MKKRIFLILAIFTLLMCVFAISVSAKTIYKDSDGNELFSYEDSNGIISSYEGEFPKNDENGNALTWYVTATGSENGNTIKTVASILTLDESYITLNEGEYSYKTSIVTNRNVVSVNFPSDKGITTLNLVDDGYKRNNGWDPTGTEILFVYLPSTLTTLPSRIVQGSKALVCDMPSEMPIKEISRVAFYEAKCLREVNIPSSVTAIRGTNKNDGAAFYSCVSLERVTFGENSQLEVIETMAFNLCSNLKYIKIPDSVKKIGQHGVSYTDLRESPFGPGSLCEEMGGRCFANIPNLESFIVPASLKKVELLGNDDYGPLAESHVNLVTFGNSATINELLVGFFARAEIDKIILPDGPTNIPTRYFMYATLKDVCFSSTIETASERAFQSARVEVIRLGASFKHFINSIDDNHSFTHALTGLKEVYIPASFYAQKPDTIYHVGHALECGNSGNMKFFYTGNADELAISRDNFANGTKNSGTNNGKFKDATAISYEEYINNTNKYSTGNYIIYGYDPCKAFCEPFYTENMEFKASISYESYLENGTKSVVCPICNTLGDGVSVEPLFKEIGYSVPEDIDRGGIVIGYMVNYDAIADYEKATGKTISYGVYAVAQKMLGENDIFDQNGNVANGVVNAKVERNTYVSFEFKLVGFDEDTKDEKLALGAYVALTKDNVTEYSYIQLGTPAEGAKYAFTSYTEYLASFNK